VETIVVGFDGSETSLVALDWVAERAAQHSAQVEIVMIGGTLMQDDVGRDADLAEAERRVHDRAPDAETGTRRVPGSMPEALLRRAETADLLVVGSHRGHPVWTALSRGMPLRITARARTPVVVVPDDWNAAGGSVVVGVDDDDSAAAALDFAAAEASAAATSLIVVHSWQMPVPRMEGSVALIASPIEARAGHRRILRAAVERARSAQPALVVQQVLAQSSPATALLEASRSASMVVLGTHHRGSWSTRLVGSVAHDVLGQSRTPVCVVPRGDAAAP
jgi:nucleotide-binding universal stress UspA family protein